MSSAHVVSLKLMVTLEIIRTIYVVLLLFGFALATAVPASTTLLGLDKSSEEAFIVDTGYARYLGNFTPPFSVAYLGVPYAEPPVGDLRFHNPVALNTWKLRKAGGIVDARSYPNFCVQGSTGEGDAGGAGTEDCLKVNIYAPANATAQSKLPVLFYIHGGGYVYGNPQNWPFDHWVNQSPNVVVVSVYYRLDSFGFLAHPDFESDPLLGDFNVGFQDQILALRWVQDNIAAFGGDPSRVTINGESAGGGSVQLHLIANECGQKLFSGAIAQSVDRETMPTPEQQLPLFKFYATQAGCGGNLNSTGKTMSCLRSISISALARAQDAGATFNETLYNKWKPVNDGKIIPDFPTKLLAEGKFARVPVIAGSTSNETLFSGTNLTELLHSIYPLLTSDELEEFNEVYDKSQLSSEDEWIRTGTGEPFLRCGREIIGNAGVEFSKTWTYRYNQPNPTLHEPGITGHAAENWMMFLGTNTGTNGSTVFTGLDEVETAFSEELIAYWLSFVRSGDPNTFKLARSPEWPDFSTNTRPVLQQDPRNSTVRSGVYVEVEPTGDAKRCAFVASKFMHMQD